MKVGTFSESGDLSPIPDPVTVTRENVTDGFEFTFTGGSILLLANTGHVADKIKLTCPNLDKIIMTLTSPPSS